MSKLNFDARSRFGEVAEALGSFYRKYFIQGQSDFRAGFAPADDIRNNSTAYEAWQMGWQADAAVEQRGLTLSHLGIIVPKPVDLDYVEEIDSVSNVQGEGSNSSPEVGA